MATIIKQDSHSQAPDMQLRTAAYDLTDMAGQADDYLARVRLEARKIIQQAEQESAAIREQSEAAGRKAAENAIERILDEKVAKQMETLTPALVRSVQQIEDSRQDWLAHWESSAVKLAGAIAVRIIGRELQTQPEIALEWLREALSLAAGAAEITVRLHPQDHATLGNQIAALAGAFTAAAPATIVSDESITVGGCRIETQFGSIDKQIETQVERITEELL